MQQNFNIPKGYHIRKKVRGSTRKLHSLESKFESILLDIPDESFAHDKVWHYHLPNPSRLVDSTNSSYKLRKKFLQLLADKLVELDKITKGKYRTLLLITLPYLSQSRIDICVDIKHFEKLVSNTDSPSKWTPLSSERNITRELDLVLPTEYRSKGFFRNSTDLNTKLIEENWIIWREG